MGLVKRVKIVFARFAQSGKAVIRPPHQAWTPEARISGRVPNPAPFPVQQGFGRCRSGVLSLRALANGPDAGQTVIPELGSCFWTQ